MTNVSSNWQNSLDRRLVNRLNRPSRQPGMMKKEMSQRIIGGCDRFLNHLPLLEQQMQRWNHKTTLSFDDVPITYVQPAASTPAESLGENHKPGFQPTVTENQPSVPIVQRKIDSAQTLPAQIGDWSIPFQNTTDLSGYDLSDESNLSTTSANPVVSEQSVSEGLTSKPEMPLATPSPDAQTSVSNSASVNPNIPSTSDDKRALDLSSENGHEPIVVSEQSVSEGLTSKPEMLLLPEFRSIAKQASPVIKAKREIASVSPSSLPTVHPTNGLANPQQRQQVNLTQKPISLATDVPNYKNKNNQSTYSLPLVSVSSEKNSTLPTQPLPLYTGQNSASSNTNSHKPNPSKQQPIVSDTDSYSSLSAPVETFVSPIAKQPNMNIDIDTITNKVEYKLMRRLEIERLRRGRI